MKASTRIVIRERLLGYDVETTSLAETVDAIVRSLATSQTSKWLACLNPHSYVVSRGDPHFARALRDADWLLPDGVGIVLASRVLGGAIRERVGGQDVFAALHPRLNDIGGVRVFFLGSTADTLFRIQRRIEREFPRITFAGAFPPPFKSSFSAEENQEMIDAVNVSRPDVLWVGLTAPKQEKWIYDHKTELEVKFIGAVGAAFDYYAGIVKVSPPLLRKHGLDWLPRLVQQPRRLWRRTFISAPIFLWHVLLERLGADTSFPVRPPTS